MPDATLEGRFAHVKELVNDQWADLEAGVIWDLDRRTFCLQCKSRALDEQFDLRMLTQHGDVGLLKVVGTKGRRERLVGYGLIYGGYPYIHHDPEYVVLSYSEAEDVRRRDVTVIYNDRNCRLIKAGVGTADYMWVSRMAAPSGLNFNLPDAKTHRMFSKVWKDGT